MPDPLVAELALVEARAVRQRAVRRAVVVPLRLVAAAYLGGSVVVLLIGRDHLGSYFLPAYVGSLLGGSWWYRREARRLGVQFPIRPWVLILAPTAVIGAACSGLGEEYGWAFVNIAGPALSTAVALGVTGVWLHARRLVVTAGVMACASVAAFLIAAGDRAVSLQLVTYGLLLWHASRGSR